MKTINIIPVCLFVMLLSASFPALAADKSMKDDMKMASDAMKKKSMTADTRIAMLAGTDGHHAAGKVKFAREMGHDLLVLSDIKVDKVPDGYVYLAKQGDRKKGIKLGMLKHFSGDVSYELPEGTALNTYDGVIIYCEKFDVEIGRAEFKEKM